MYRDLEYAKSLIPRLGVREAKSSGDTMMRGDKGQDRTPAKLSSSGTGSDEGWDHMSRGGDDDDDVISRDGLVGSSPGGSTAARDDLITRSMPSPSDGLSPSTSDDELGEFEASVRRSRTRRVLRTLTSPVRNRAQSAS